MEGIVGVLMGFLIFVAIVGIIGAGAIIFGIVWGVRRALYAVKGEEYKPLIGGKVSHDYEHQDIDAGSTAETITRVLRRYLRVETVGKYARAGLAALENEQKKSANFYGVLDNKFQRNSLSWGKFSVAGEAAHDTILRNCASLANRIQVFDFVEYRRIERVYRNASYRKDVAPNDMQMEKHHLMHTSLSEMDALVASNDKLLLELDKLTAELGTLAGADSSENSDRIVEEIRSLIDETKYYK